jgi:hypothetical protein
MKPRAALKVRSSVAMPRTSSTSFITGTGFMKWMPMKRSGRSVADGQPGDRERRGVGGEDRLGIELRAELLVDLALDGFVFGGCLDDEIHGCEATHVSAKLIRARAASRSVSVVLPEATWRARLPLMVASIS